MSWSPSSQVCVGSMEVREYKRIRANPSLVLRKQIPQRYSAVTIVVYRWEVEVFKAYTRSGQRGWARDPMMKTQEGILAILKANALPKECIAKEPGDETGQVEWHWESKFWPKMLPTIPSQQLLPSEPLSPHVLETEEWFLWYQKYLLILI